MLGDSEWFRTVRTVQTKRSHFSHFGKSSEADSETLDWLPSTSSTLSSILKLKLFTRLSRWRLLLPCNWRMNFIRWSRCWPTGRLFVDRTFRFEILRYKCCKQANLMWTRKHLIALSDSPVGLTSSRRFVVESFNFKFATLQDIRRWITTGDVFRNLNLVLMSC